MAGTRCRIPVAKAEPSKIPDALVLTYLRVSAAADLADVTFTYNIKPANRSANAGIQIYAHRDDPAGENQWEQIAPKGDDGGPLVLKLYKGLTATGTFTLPLPAGKYGAYRLILFKSADGKSVDYGKPIFDTADTPDVVPNPNLHLTVATSQSRVTKPTLIVGRPEVTERGTGKFEVTIPGSVRLPVGFTGPDTGFNVMAKGTGGYSQVWAPVKDAKPSGDENDAYKTIPVLFRINDVKPGVWNVQFGLFHANWGDPIEWLWPGSDFEAGGDAWVKKAPADGMPPRVRVKAGHFVNASGHAQPLVDGPAAKAAKFVRGGNYGNAITWTAFPEFNTPGYFVLLRDMGCRFIRFNFNPDRYAGEALYQHAVDQVVQNILSAGIYPLISPQDLPKGPSRSIRVTRGLAVVRLMARKYAGQSVWLEICNEPKDFKTWTEWKPVAEKYVREIREIDPNAFVVVPFEGWSKDGRGAAKSPITSVAVDLYDGHAYLSPGETITNFAPAIKAGLPVLIGEYGGNDPEYLRSIDRKLQSLPDLIAAAPWAFTVKGQDSLPLIEDGKSAELKYTPAGAAIAADYEAWDAGRRID
jgi:hypothetical protein